MGLGLRVEWVAILESEEVADGKGRIWEKVCLLSVCLQ